MPDTTRTYGELLTDFMRRCGYASLTNGVIERSPQDSTVAQFQTDFHEAAREFVMSHMWSWRSQRFRLDVNNLGTAPLSVRPPKANESDPEPVGSPWQYSLDDWVMGVGSEFSWWELSNGHSCKMQHVSPALIRQSQASRLNTLSFPEYFALEQARESTQYLNNPQLSSRPSMRLLLYPTPYAAMVIDLSVRLRYMPMQDTAESPPWPTDCDDAVVTLAVANHLRGGVSPKPGLNRNDVLNDYREAFARLKKEDSQNKSVVQVAMPSRTALLRDANATYLDGSPL